MTKLVLCLGGIATLGFAVPATARGLAPARGCSAPRGVYAVHLTGTALGKPIAVVGHLHFGERGTLTGDVTQVWHGQPRRAAVDGSHSVDAACLGQVAIATEDIGAISASTFDFYGSASGDRLFLTLTRADGLVILGGTADRLAQTSIECDVTTLRGVYAGLTRGDTDVGPMAVINRPVFDGRGNVEDPFTVVAAAGTDRSRYLGTYFVDQQCRGTMELSGEHYDGHDSHRMDFYLADQGARIVWVVTNSRIERMAGVGVDPVGVNGEVPGNAGELNSTIGGFWEQH